MHKQATICDFVRLEWRLPTKGESAKIKASNRESKSGKIGWALLWLMGVPIPILAIFFLLRCCD
jgi:hypothetical protein